VHVQLETVYIGHVIRSKLLVIGHRRKIFCSVVGCDVECGFLVPSFLPRGAMRWQMYASVTPIPSCNTAEQLFNNCHAVNGKEYSLGIMGRDGIIAANSSLRCMQSVPIITTEFSPTNTPIAVFKVFDHLSSDWAAWGLASHTDSDIGSELT